MGLGMCGPVIIGHGTPAQKAHYLPRMLSGEDFWCQGYSEPGSGSDLASLQMSAKDAGHLAFAFRVEMQHHDKRAAAVGRHRVEETAQGLDAACRSADADDRNSLVRNPVGGLLHGGIAWLCLRVAARAVSWFVWSLCHGRPHDATASYNDDRSTFPTKTRQTL